MYGLRFSELLEVLGDEGQRNRFDSRASLRKRVLNLLSTSSAKQKNIRQKILQAYKFRPILDYNTQQQSLPLHQQNVYRHPQPRHRPLCNPPQCNLQLSQGPQRHHRPYQQSMCQLPQQLLQHNPSYVPYSINDVHTAYSQTSSNYIARTSFKQIPFFKNVETLLRPIHCISYAGAIHFDGLFFLTDTIRNSIIESWDKTNQEFKTQIVLRLLQVGQKKNFPARLPFNITVSVNDRQCKLNSLETPGKTGIAPWLCDISVEITHETNLTPNFQNQLKVTWSKEPYEYIAGVFVIQKLTWYELLLELKKRPACPIEKTVKLTKNILKSDADLGADSIFVSIKDPLGTMRMELPVRGQDCTHLQCFDAVHFLRLNAKKQTWTCPLCKKEVQFENIEIDELFLKILHSPNLSKKCENIFLFQDGSWTEKKEFQKSLK